jgi:hypothetical protein
MLGRMDGKASGAGFVVARRRRIRSWWPRAALLVLAIAALTLSGCNDDEDCICCGPDTRPPAAPRGLYSITGDEEITLVWLANTEPDLAGYYVWWSDDYSGTYHFIAEVPACGGCYTVEFVDTEAANGETYFYAVSAVDDAGHESELSYEEVWDTPRPEGVAALSARDVDIETAGFDLSTGEVVAADSRSADFYYVVDEFGGVIYAGSLYYTEEDLTDIQDMGATADGFDEIDFAPDNTGWSPLRYVEAIEGHTYVLLTRTNRYAKIRLTGVGGDQLAFQWAYQSVEWNRQLKHPVAP